MMELFPPITGRISAFPLRRIESQRVCTRHTPITLCVMLASSSARGVKRQSEAKGEGGSQRVRLAPMINESKGLIWYLGYGSNMNRGIFEGRRGYAPDTSGTGPP